MSAPARACLAIIVCLVAAYCVTDLVVRPSMFSDSGWGLLGWDAMRRGSPFNYSLLPDPADISRDLPAFMTGWSPGQHVLPGLLEYMGVTLGVAFAVVATVFSVLGLAGWFALYRAFAFDAQIAMIALLIAVCSRFFSLPFSIYNGGEVLLFGTAPWFMLLAWKLRDFRASAVPALLAGSVVLFFAKLSGFMLAVVAIGAASVSDERPWTKRDTLRKVLVAGIIVGAMGLAFHQLWLVRGWTPAPQALALDLSRLVTHTAFSLSAIVGGAFSPGDLASWLFLRPGHEILVSIDELYFAAAPLALVVLAFVCWRLRIDHADYLRFFLLIAAGTVVVMVGMWVLGSPVSLEERHFRPVSMLFLVGLVDACLRYPRRWLRGAFLIVAGAASFYGLVSFANRSAGNLHYPLGIRGFRHTIADEGALKFLHRIDAVGPRGQVPLVLVTSPEMALELRHARVLADQADFQSIDDLSRQVYRGRVPELYVVVQKRLVEDGKAEAILRSFADYAPDKWSRQELGDFVAFSQGAGPLTGTPGSR